MAEPNVASSPACDSQAGFTLTEMLVALGILMFGLTALAGSMMQGASQRRGSEMRFRAVHMVDKVFYDIREKILPSYPLGTDLPSELPVVEDIPGYAGLKYRVRFLVDPRDTQVVLARVWITWKEQGELFAERFDRAMIRETPFSRRISRLKKGESR